MISDLKENENAVERVLTRRKRELTNVERNAILQALLQRSTDYALELGAIKQVSLKFGVGRNTVGRIWKRALDSLANGSNVMEVSSKKSNCGRKRKCFTEELASFSTIPMHQRSSLSSAAKASRIPKTTLIRRFKEGILRKHCNVIKLHNESN